MDLRINARLYLFAEDVKIRLVLTSYSVTVRGKLGSDIAATTSTNGTSRIAACGAMMQCHPQARESVKGCAFSEAIYFSRQNCESYTYME